MGKFRFLTCLFFVLGNSIIGQGQYFEYSSPQKIPAAYVFDPFDYYNTVVEKGKDGERKKNIKRWAEISAYGKTALFENGAVYLAWTDLESYLNEVLQKVYPNSIQEGIHIYVSRTPELNAFATHDGSLFINIGLLAEVQDEAALATIMGHEIAHYLNHDMENSFYNKLELFTKKNRNDNYELSVEKAHDDREQERIADLRGFQLADAAGYDLNSVYNNFYLFLDLDKKQEAKAKSKGLSTVSSDKDKEEGLLATHPETVERIEALDQYLDGHPQAGKKKFIISQKKFEYFKSVAKIETIKRLLYLNNNLEAFDKVMTYFLFDTGNGQYVYYMLEALRRHLYLNDDAKRSQLLKEYYHQYISEGTWKELLEVQVRDSSQLKILNFDHDKEFPGGKLPTFEEFMVFLEKEANKRKIQEAYLSLALYYINSKEENLFYLDKYISGESPKNLDYVQALSANKLTSDIDGDQRILLFDEVSFIEDRYYGYRNKLLFARTMNQELYHSFKNIVIDKHFPERKCISINELKQQNLKQYEDYIALIGNILHFNSHVSPESNQADEESADEPSVIVFDDEGNVEMPGAKNETGEENGSTVAPTLFIYNPEMWTIYKRYRIKTLEYVSATAFDDKTSIAGSFWYLLMPRTYLERLVSYGSERYSYKAQYWYIDVANETTYYRKNIVNFRFRKPHMNNTLYHLISESQKALKTL